MVTDASVDRNNAMGSFTMGKKMSRVPGALACDRSHSHVVQWLNTFRVTSERKPSSVATKTQAAGLRITQMSQMMYTTLASRDDTASAFSRGCIYGCNPG